MNPHDERLFWSGVLFIVLGAITLVQVPGYALGSAARMGPGYFPMLVAIVLVSLGAAAAWKGRRGSSASKIGAWPVFPIAFVTAGVLSFAALIERVGLVASVVLIVALSCYDRILRRPLEVALVALVVIVVSSAVFIYGVGLPIALW